MRQIHFNNIILTAGKSHFTEGAAAQMTTGHSHPDALIFLFKHIFNIPSETLIAAMSDIG